MLIAIDAGHYLGTPGKRCLKSIDPNETREWVLNARIADHLQTRLSLYDCITMRVDDTTGEKDVSLGERVTQANKADADVYLSIHHNAGINGGPGGGIVVYTYTDPSQASTALQRAVYEHTVRRTGLRGNRANPMPTANLYVLRTTRMPAVLCELGFMDSTTDTPIILTEEFASQAADGIIDALVEVYGIQERGDPMTEEQVRKLVREEYAKIEAERAALPPSAWARPYIQQAIDGGAMTESADGSIDRPRAYATREELAVVASSLIN